jgi:hypothetical protein
MAIHARGPDLCDGNAIEDADDQGSAVISDDDEGGKVVDPAGDADETRVRFAEEEVVDIAEGDLEEDGGDLEKDLIYPVVLDGR